MYKIMVHIANDNQYMDEDVSVEIKLPGIPRIGETVFLDRKHLDVLENKAKSSLDIGGEYFPQWFSHIPFPDKPESMFSYNDLDYEDLKPENLRDISFSGARLVHNIYFEADSNETHIELTRDHETCLY